MASDLSFYDQKDIPNVKINPNFPVTVCERRAFKAFCAANVLTQTAGFRSGFGLLKKEHGET